MATKYIALLLIALPVSGNAVEYRIRRLNLPMTAEVIDMNSHGEVLYRSSTREDRLYYSGRKFTYILTRTGENIKMPVPAGEDTYFHSYPRGISDDGTICGIYVNRTGDRQTGNFIWNYRTGFTPAPPGINLIDINDQGEVATDYPGYTNSVYNYVTGTFTYMDKGLSSIVSIANNGWVVGNGDSYRYGRRLNLQDTATVRPQGVTDNGYFYGYLFRLTGVSEMRIWNPDGSIRGHVSCGTALLLTFNSHLEGVGSCARNPMSGWPVYYSPETGVVDFHTIIVNFNDPYPLQYVQFLQDNGLALAYAKFTFLPDVIPWGKYYLLEPIRD